MVVRLSDLRAGRPLPPGKLLVLISVRVLTVDGDYILNLFAAYNFVIIFLKYCNFKEYA
jgi:hypothetical protein